MQKKSKYAYYLWLITIVASFGGLLFGFDMAVISGVLPLVKTQFSLSALNEGWFVSSALIGCIIGVSISGELSDRFGRKRLLLIAAILFLLSAAACILVKDFTGLILARICAGVGVGIASIIVPLYISEVAPAHSRGRLVTCYQLAITIGIVLAYLSNAWLLNAKSSGNSYFVKYFIQSVLMDEVWRGMLAIGVVPALFFIFGVLFIPESPRWLMIKGFTEKARAIGNRLDDQQVTPVNFIVPNDRGAYKELFSIKHRKALLLGILLPLFSQFSGINAIVYYGPSILNKAGVSLNNSLLSQILFGLTNMLFTLIAIWKVDKIGRRPLYIVGTITASASLFLTGLLFHIGQGSGIWLLFCVVVFLASFAFSIGPLKFVVISEIYPTRIRGRAMAISIMVMWIADTIVGQLTPVMLSGIGIVATFWVFSLFCFIAFLTIYKLLPETKGRSLEEIESDMEIASPKLVRN